MDTDERRADARAVAAWFADEPDENATKPVGAVYVPPDYETAFKAVGGAVIRTSPPPAGLPSLQELVTAYVPRWRVGGVYDHARQRCPLCYAGYAFGRAESVRLPEMAILCFSCQRDIEMLCFTVAAALSRLYGRAVTSLEVMARFFAEVAPLGPLARRYGHAYE